MATGLRYAFVNGSDVRAECLFQEAGYSASEINGAWSVLAPTTLAQGAVYSAQAGKMSRLGLEFPGQQYLLLSLRVPEPWQFRDWTVYFRDLLSLQDGSSSAYLMSELAFGTSGTMLAALAHTFGAPERELRGTIADSVTLGYRHTW